MLHTEIEQLKARIVESVPERQSNEDEKLAALTYQPGWEVLKRRIDKRINVLLEPGTKSEDLNFVGAITKAREFAIYELRGVVSDVENAKHIKKNVVSEQVSE